MFLKQLDRFFSGPGAAHWTCMLSAILFSATGATIAELNYDIPRAKIEPYFIGFILIYQTVWTLTYCLLSARSPKKS